MSRRPAGYRPSRVPPRALAPLPFLLLISSSATYFLSPTLLGDFPQTSSVPPVLSGGPNIPLPRKLLRLLLAPTPPPRSEYHVAIHLTADPEAWIEIGLLG